MANLKHFESIILQEEDWLYTSALILSGSLCYIQHYGTAYVAKKRLFIFGIIHSMQQWQSLVLHDSCQLLPV
ncbi:unnamed protein product [Victoria cruziana]